MRNLDSCRCWRCRLCPCKVKSKFLMNFWNCTILLCIPCIWPPTGFCRPGRPHPWQRRNFWPAKHLLTPHERTPSISVVDWLCGPLTNLVTCVINPLKVKNNVLYVKISSSHLTENTVSFHQEDQTVYAVQRITAVYNTWIVWNRIHKYTIWAN
jgi:hypothetical protein